MLTEGDFKTAEIFLGRPFSISGKVAHGDQIGRTIGFPTANIGIKRRLSPVLGVYSVHIEHRLKNLYWSLQCWKASNSWGHKNTS